MRNTFIETLIKKAEIDLSIILIVGDLGYNVIEPFQSKFPDRFINAGVCEQNMASMAAGLASEGFKVFIYSIANFPTFRCAEQIRNDICYHNLDVTIVTVGGGLAYGNLGYSHHAIQDYGLIRLFPEITILSPGDPNEVNFCMDFIFYDKYPKYLRLRKAGENNFNQNKELKAPGFWNNITKSKSKKIFLSTGYGLKLANDLIEKNQIYNDFGIYSCPIWGAKYSHLQEKIANRFDEIITIEDHLLHGGFGSWILETVKEKEPTLEISNGFIDSSIIGRVGSESYLLEYFKIK